MNDGIIKLVAALTLVGSFSGTVVFAQHEGMNMENMGGMKMEDMKVMKQDCMSKNKSGKMCDKQMMDKCEMKMSKGDCKKMMNHAMSPATEKQNN